MYKKYNVYFCVAISDSRIGHYLCKTFRLYICLQVLFLICVNAFADCQQPSGNTSQRCRSLHFKKCVGQHIFRIAAKKKKTRRTIDRNAEFAYRVSCPNDTVRSQQSCVSDLVFRYLPSVRYGSDLRAVGSTGNDVPTSIA